MKFWFVLLIVCLLLSVGVSALSCDYDPDPMIASDLSLPSWVPDRFQLGESRIWWNCVSNMTNYTCLSSVHDNSEGTPVLQVNPDARNIKSVGVIDSFVSDGRYVSAYFRSERNIIRNNVLYEFDLHCSNGTNHEEFSADVTPKYRDFDAPTTFFAQNMPNLNYWIIGFPFFIAVFAVLLWFVRKLKVLKSV